MKNMKNLYRVALLAALGLASVSAVQAQTSDLLLGFNDAAGPTSAQNDYVIDLGVTGAQLLANAQAGGGSYTFNNIISASTFNAAFGSDANSLNNVAAGVVSGINGTSQKLLYVTSASTPNSISSAQFANSVASASSSATGEYGSSSTAGWTEFVATSPTAQAGEIGGGVAGNSGANPEGLLSSGILTINFYENIANKVGLGSTVTGWVDEGTFTINENNDTVTFATPVPEPATYGLLAASGLLIIAFRRQFKGKNA